MDEPEPGRDRTTERFESAIGLAAPFLDLVLAVGERISRLAEPTDYEYYPIRSEEREDESGPDSESGR
ncbi:MAG: hypothetical protein JJE10_05210 [Thermoleophilia bacterium]|nr:hypothetical protein [Thermoleophilia bacterium]